MTENKPKKQLGLKIAAVVCLCILAYSLFCLFTATSFFPWSHEVHEPVYISASSAEEAVELFGDDLLLRRFAEIDGENKTARYTLTMKDESATINDRSGWSVLDAFNFGDGFSCIMNIAFNGVLSYGGEFDGKTDINGITVRYWSSPPTAENGGTLSAVFERGGYKYHFSYSYKNETDNYDMAWQALCTLLEG